VFYQISTAGGGAMSAELNQNAAPGARRSLVEIRADILALEKETDGLLRKAIE